MTVKKRSSFRHLLLQGIYDPRINQGMWLSLATVLLLLSFYLVGYQEYAICSVLAILPSLIAGVNQPAPRYSFWLARVDLLFFCCSFLVLGFLQLDVPLAIIFFPLIFILAMFAAYGNQSGRIGTGAMIVATLSLSWPGDRPFWIFPLLLGLGTLWYGAFSRFWMLWWGHKVLRDKLGQLFTEIANYYVQKAKILQHTPSREQFTAVFKQQERVYRLISEIKIYFNRYGEMKYNQELKALEQDFLLGVDLMELLQANQYRVEEIRKFIGESNVTSLYTDFAVSLTAVLKKKAFAIKTRRWIEINLDNQLDPLEEGIVAGLEKNPTLAHSLIVQFTMIRSLLTSQEPAFQRSLGMPDPAPGLIETLRPHLNFRSPVFRYGLRLSVTVSCGILLAGWLSLEKSYWLILAILFVMQSGYLLTRTLITQRVIGTLGGVLLGLAFIQLPVAGWLHVCTMILLALFSLSMIFHHKLWSILGVTALVVMGFQIVSGQGQEIVFTRIIDTLLGCGLAFISNLLLWPQWHGGGIKRLLKETLEAQEDILILCVRSLSDSSIKSEHLTRRRLKLFTAQNNLLASYQQMLREPQHTHQYVDSLDQVLGHFVAASSHINALLSLSREAPQVSRELTTRLERMIIALFDRCAEEQKIEDIDLQKELEVVYRVFEQMKEGGGQSPHHALMHVSKCIYERLNTIFDILDFCKS
jgi:uncharacterized membrane protein YccC